MSTDTFDKLNFWSTFVSSISFFLSPQLFSCFVVQLKIPPHPGPGEKWIRTSISFTHFYTLLSLSLSLTHTCTHARTLTHTHAHSRTHSISVACQNLTKKGLQICEAWVEESKLVLLWQERCNLGFIQNLSKTTWGNKEQTEILVANLNFCKKMRSRAFDD